MKSPHRLWQDVVHNFMLQNGCTYSNRLLDNFHVQISNDVCSFLSIKKFLDLENTIIAYMHVRLVRLRFWNPNNIFLNIIR